MANVDSPLLFRYSSRMSSPVSYDLQGQGGGVVLSFAGAQTDATGSFRWIQVVSDTVLAGLTSDNIANAGDLVGVMLPAGLGIGGRFSFIDVTSGVVVAYRS